VLGSWINKKRDAVIVIVGEEVMGILYRFLYSGIKENIRQQTKTTSFLEY